MSAPTPNYGPDKLLTAVEANTSHNPTNLPLDHLAAAPEPDPEALRWWQHHLFDRCDPTDWVIASILPSGDGKWRENVLAFPVGKRAGAVDKLTSLARQGDLYLTCCPRAQRPLPRKRGGADTVGTLPGFWSDIDVRGPRHAATNLPPTDAEALSLAYSVGKTPSLTLYSGGGLQLWWLLEEPLVIDDGNRSEVADLVKGWGRTMAAAGELNGWHVDQVSDLPRVLRPAGSINYKTGQNGQSLPPLAVEVGAGPDVPTRYSLDALRALIVPEKPKWTAPSKPPDYRPPPPSGVPDGPADLVAALPWSAILEPLRWEFVGTTNIPSHGVAEQWRRPGGMSTHSGNFWENYGTIHSDNAGTAMTHKALSKFAVYAELYHGGDTSAAGRVVWSKAVARWGDSR